MKRLVWVIPLGLAACDSGQQTNTTSAPTAAIDPVAATQAPTSKPPSVIPRPKDQAELDRLILAGYTPHSNHLHPPGVKECPLAQGNDAVM